MNDKKSDDTKSKIVSKPKKPYKSHGTINAPPVFEGFGEILWSSWVSVDAKGDNE